jgi:Restriction endonuclease fold toxin 7
MPWTIEDVKNVKHLAFTQQISDYLEYAQENGLTFILHTRPQTTYSTPLQGLIDAGHIVQKAIPGLPK